MDFSRPYPFLLSPRIKQCLWGRADWSGLISRPLPQDPPVGELWLNDDRPGGSRVLNGPLEGTGLDVLVRENYREVIGLPKGPGERFPLLIKFLNTSKWLSVQVHPDSSQYGPGQSKTEAWYILRAPEEPSLILGLKPGTDRPDLEQAIEGRTLPDLLNKYPARAGQSLFISGGLVHSIGPDMLLFEIQQNNDITYRLFDWDRLDSDGRPRELHLEKSLEAIQYSLEPARPAQTVTLDCPGGTRTWLSACGHFMLCRLDLAGPHNGETKGSFRLLTGLEGRGLVTGGGHEVEIGPGDTVLIPAALDQFGIVPQDRLVLLESTAPDLLGDVVAPLKSAKVEDRVVIGLAGSRGEREMGPLIKAWEEQQG